MLDEERIRVMTKLAVFEKEKGKDIELASHYYKNDYISYHMIWSAVTATVAYVLMWAIVLLCGMDYFLNHISDMKIGSVIALVIVLYICFIVLFEGIAFLVYRKRFKTAQKSIKEYCSKLKELEKIYNKEHLRQEQMRKEKNMRTGGSGEYGNFTGI